MAGSQVQSSPGWGEQSKDWGGGFKQRGGPTLPQPETSDWQGRMRKAAPRPLYKH